MTPRVETATIPPAALPEPDAAAVLSWQLRRWARLCSMRSRCSRVRPPANWSIYFDPCSTITSGKEVMAIFWSRPDTTWDATTSLLSSSNWIVGRRASGGPKEIGFSPKPRGMMTATGAVPLLRAASAVAALYSGCAAPFTGAGRVSTTRDPSSSKPRTRPCAALL